MALLISLTGIPHKTGDFDWFVDCVGWRPYELKHDPRFRAVHLNPSYADFAAVLSVDEALAIHMERLEALRSAAGHPSGSDEEALRLLQQHRETTRFVVAHIYEWESGLPD